MERPLVSIYTNCKNGAHTIRRAITSILAQDYPHIEYIFQDGASTDGTLDIVREYGDRIKLISEPDSCGEEGFFRALNRCRGAIIGSCMADEEMLPHAVSWAVENFSQHPDAGAIYGDCYATDMQGNILDASQSRHPFDIIQYICHEIVPPFAATFFSQKALLAAGLQTREWAYGIGEFEVWQRVGMRFPIYYSEGYISKFALGGRSSQSKIILQLLPGREKILDQIFSDPDTPSYLIPYRQRAFAGLHLWVTENLINQEEYYEAKNQLLLAIACQPKSPDIERLTDLSRKLCDKVANTIDQTNALEILDYLKIPYEAGIRFEGLQMHRAQTLFLLGNYKDALEAANQELSYPGYQMQARELISKISTLLKPPTIDNAPIFPEEKIPVEQSHRNTRDYSINNDDVTRQRVGRLLNRTRDISDQEFKVSLDLFSLLISSPNIPDFIDRKKNIFPEALIPLALLYLRKAWLSEDELLAGAMESIIGMLLNQKIRSVSD